MPSKKLTLGVLLLISYGPLSGYDADLSGVSDVYENIHGRVLPEAEDADFDGYSNYLESLFGSNPLSATSPGDLGFTKTGQLGTLQIPNQVGLRFRLQASQTLAIDSWQPFGDFLISDGSAGIAEFDLGGANKSFFRIELAPPLNSDSDGLNDWEEAQLGTDPALSDTDDDLLDDDIETMIAGSNPLLVDTDGDGFVDKDEYESGSDPNDANALPPEFLAKAAHLIQVYNEAAPIHFIEQLWSSPTTVQNIASNSQLLGQAWSSPVIVQNESVTSLALYSTWSSPIIVQNESVTSLALYSTWSSPIIVQNESVTSLALYSTWSSPIIVHNESVSLSLLGEAWSAPILVSNTYTAALSE